MCILTPTVEYSSNIYLLMSVESKRHLWELVLSFLRLSYEDGNQAWYQVYST